MSEEGTAIKDQDQIVSSEGGDEVIVPDPNADQIVVEGEEPTPATSTGPAWLHKRIGRLNKKVGAAEEGQTEAERIANLTKEENKLLKLQIQQLGSTTKPDRANFESDEDFLVAQTKHDDDRIATKAKEIVTEVLSGHDQKTTLEKQSQATEAKLTAHYDRATELKVSDYADTEDKAIEVLGDDISKFIMSSTAKSHLILYHLGKNPVKAGELAARIRKDPGSGTVEIGELAAKITLRKADTQLETPEPATDLSGGGTPAPTEHWQKKLNTLRDKVAANDGSANMGDILQLKKDAVAAGVTTLT